MSSNTPDGGRRSRRSRRPTRDSLPAWSAIVAGAFLASNTPTAAYESSPSALPCFQIPCKTRTRITRITTRYITEKLAPLKFRRCLLFPSMSSSTRLSVGISYECTPKFWVSWQLSNVYKWHLDWSWPLLLSTV